MKPKDIRGLATEDLDRKLGELREELFNLRFQATTEPIDNPGKVRALRKDIARIETIKRERAPQAASSEGAK